MGTGWDCVSEGTTFIKVFGLPGECAHSQSFRMVPLAPWCSLSLSLLTPTIPHFPLHAPKGKHCLSSPVRGITIVPYPFMGGTKEGMKFLTHPNLSSHVGTWYNAALGVFQACQIALEILFKLHLSVPVWLHCCLSLGLWGREESRDRFSRWSWQMLTGMHPCNILIYKVIWATLLLLALPLHPLDGGL